MKHINAAIFISVTSAYSAVAGAQSGTDFLIQQRMLQQQQQMQQQMSQQQIEQHRIEEQMVQQKALQHKMEQQMQQRSLDQMNQQQWRDNMRGRILPWFARRSTRYYEAGVNIQNGDLLTTPISQQLVENFVYLAENEGLETAERFLTNVRLSFYDLAD